MTTEEIESHPDFERRFPKFLVPAKVSGTCISEFEELPENSVPILKRKNRLRGPCAKRCYYLVCENHLKPWYPSKDCSHSSLYLCVGESTTLTWEHDDERIFWEYEPILITDFGQLPQEKSGEIFYDE